MGRLLLHIVRGSQLDINLWGDYCYTLSDYIQKNPNILQIVIILQFAKINVRQAEKIADIFEPTEIKKYVIVLTIKGILNNTPWHYPTCTNCNTKAVPKNPSDCHI
uniref:Uncharacterized protein n=1 Tax=Lactuca sativa TaxID=4236 RepID=A0A9R1VV94_LACSA|nr:hypothetical protein LSAT_V11C400226240 [Lactuca sativa]